jgi:hypothetical protein
MEDVLRFRLDFRDGGKSSVQRTSPGGIEHFCEVGEAKAAGWLVE